jgi:hypothetical protein
MRAKKLHKGGDGFMVTPVQRLATSAKLVMIFSNSRELFHETRRRVPWKWAERRSRAQTFLLPCFLLAYRVSIFELGMGKLGADFVEQIGERSG